MGKVWSILWHHPQIRCSCVIFAGIKLTLWRILFPNFLAPSSRSKNTQSFASTENEPSNTTTQFLPSVFTYRYFLHRWPQLCILAVPTDDIENTDGSINNGARKNRRPIGCVVCKIDFDEESENESSNDPTSADGGGAANSESIVNDKNTIQDINSEAGTIDTRKPDTDSKPKKCTGYIGMLAVEKSHRRSGIGIALAQRAIHRMQQLGCQSIRLETEVTNKGAIVLYEDRLGFVREELLVKYYLNWGDAYRLRLWLNST